MQWRVWTIVGRQEGAEVVLRLASVQRFKDRMSAYRFARELHDFFLLPADSVPVKMDQESRQVLRQQGVRCD